MLMLTTAVLSPVYSNTDQTSVPATETDDTGDDVDAVDPVETDYENMMMQEGEEVSEDVYNSDTETDDSLNSYSEENIPDKTQLSDEDF